MKWSKKEEKELMQVYDTWWKSYLNGDVKTYDSFFTDDYHFVGSTNGEEYLNRKDTTAFFDATADQLAGKAELRNLKRSMEELEGGIILITDLADAYVISEPEWVFYSRFRFTSMLRKTTEGWRFFYQHFSSPDSKAQEGETLGTEKITKENEELRDAIKRRTVELEHKTKELQIEAALERVRAVAMGMNKPDDLVDICKQIYKELQLLGFSELRNTLIHTFFDEQSYFINYDFSDVTGGSINRIPYYGNPLMEKFIKEIRKKSDAFSELEIAGKKLEDWKAFRKANGEYEDPRLDAIQALYYYNYAVGESGIGISTYSAIDTEKLQVLKRFRNVFDLANKRYTDITKAEAQTREAQIEVSLERVRSRAMVMHNSDELREVGALLYNELSKLGIQNLVTGYTLLEDDGKMGYNYGVNPFDGTIAQLPVGTLHTETKVLKSIAASWRKQEPLLMIQLNPEETIAHQTYMAEETTNFPISKEKLLAISPERLVVHTFNFTQGYLLIVGGTLLTDDQKEMVIRFAKVFELTYTRFLDLKKAEAQAREAQIEAALERVRSRTMGMQHSAELGDVAAELFAQMNLLVSNLWTCGFVLCEKKRTEDEWWLSMDTGFTRGFFLPNVGDYAHATLYEGWEKGESFRFVQLEGNDLQEHYKWLMNLPVAKSIFEEMDNAGLERPDWQKLHAAYFSKGYLVLITRESCNEEEIFKRFAQVFDQTYTRFLDLKKAEAQTREVQIEAALEKVRSRSLAMHMPNELGEVVTVIVEKLKELGVVLDANGVVLCTYFNDSKDVLHWIVSPDFSFTGSYLLPYFDHPIFNDAWQSKESGAAYFSKAFSVEAKNSFFEYAFEHSDYKNFPDDFKKWVFQNDKHILSFAWQKNSAILIPSHTGVLPSKDEVEILKRFAKVFEQSYTRFLDLQKAEAQAREALIENGLERVRAQTMAMNKSNDLQHAVSAIFKELDKLDLKTLRCGIGIINEENKTVNVWTTTSTEDGNDVSFSGSESMDIHPVLQGAFEGWKTQKDFYYSLEGDDLIKYYDSMGGDNYKLPEAASGAKVSTTDIHYYFCTFFKAGGLYFFREIPFTDELVKVIRRFANAFSLAYKRFEDLKLSEEQAYKAKIEVALERVRARALAMQEPEELIEVAEVLRHEMGLLGVEELETCSIYINDDAIKRTECWYALKDISDEKKKLVSDHFPLNLDDTWVGREMLKFYQSDEKKISILMQGANRKEWIRYCEEISVPFRGYYGEVIPDRTYHLYKFSHGAIGAAAAGDISAESWDLLRRAASVFSLAYSRFKDLTQARTDLINLKEEKQKAEDALTNLKAAQSQLVQAEKMASLGELTAGIAHEIQNPLNFVNNFSEVSNELLDEMLEEAAKGNYEEVKEILKDVKQNLEKINHHGRRADGIVKGMLQHSRSSSGTKEPTDINALADEYLRLAYHGLRAKDKSFNATMKTEFDESLEKVNVIPQDIGRVVLNLITNAFYAVSTVASAKVDGNYNPTVTVSTKIEGDKVLISVKDNGPGIPQKVLDKIFQPFFTTKPTGQGTGLGLSLAYDIVKAHGGELKVETKENIGAEFIISLPIA